MFKKNWICLLLCLLLSVKTGFAEQRSIAITIDDLPFVGEDKNYHLTRIINTLKSNSIPATGFVIADQVNDKTRPLLQKFRNAGLSLGNHTLTHANLDKMDTMDYIREINKSDKILSDVMTRPKYFRYPYLAMGKGRKKNDVLNVLFSKHYQVAPITIDSKDFVFNQLLLSVPQNERRFFLHSLKAAYVDFIWEQTLKAHKPEQAQILLIHANLLNAYVLPDIIELYRQNGYEFITLTEALKTVGTPNKTASVKKRKPLPDSEIEDFMEWD
ncbi:polysaccharide deacetylase family protein [Legionella spiritensis]|uniref:Polysaccharide deacetylase n=1 Tax=Legionella spiritensis TaxID=452 RepID=A0A0W0Z8L4_LEGSP|nr:polysaccharide deacetylase family protein [Legionella spiritensis]KTD65283.1 polysaccharide deacetylase [Legionella spiritensis]SNV30105.1 polysaccharide deacetylase [Legionella spiritensis]